METLPKFEKVCLFFIPFALTQTLSIFFSNCAYITPKYIHFKWRPDFPSYILKITYAKVKELHRDSTSTKLPWWRGELDFQNLHNIV